MAKRLSLPALGSFFFPEAAPQDRGTASNQIKDLYGKPEAYRYVLRLSRSPFGDNPISSSHRFTLLSAMTSNRS